MNDSGGVMPVQTGGVGLPQVQLQVIEDIIPPRYPDNGTGLGANMVLQRPGELGIVVTIPLALGCMIALIPAPMAAHMRGEVTKAIAANRAAMEKQARNGVG